MRRYPSVHFLGLQKYEKEWCVKINILPEVKQND